MEGARPATDADLDRLVELAGEARSELLALRGGDVFVEREARHGSLQDGFAAALADASTAVWCGTVDGVVLGYAVVTAERLDDGRTLGRLTDIYVEAGGREVGVGELLMAEAVAWCAARGCFGIDAYALPGARQTKNFFETAGFTARLLVVHHRLDRVAP
jgi:GNAT superfamily N-acetyltransferase